MQIVPALIRFKKLIVLAALLLCSCSTSKDTTPASVSNAGSVVGMTTVLTKIADNEVPYANAQTPEDKLNDLYQIVIGPYGRGVAYIAAIDNKVRVVHNGKPGKELSAVQFVAMQLSPDGKRVVYGYKKGNQRYMVIDGSEIGPFDEVGPPVFSPDSKHVAYEVRKGDVWNIMLDSLTTRIVPSYYMKPAFSSDSTKIFYIENTNNEQKKTLIVSTSTLKHLVVVPVLAQPAAISKDNSHVAAVGEKNGKQMAIDININKPDEIKEGPLYDSVRHLSYSSDGSALAYVAMKGKDSYLVLNGNEEKLPAGDIPWAPVIRPGNKSAGIVIVGKDGAYLYQGFSDSGVKSKVYKEIAELAYSRDGKQQVHGAIRDNKFLAVVNGVEGPQFDRVVQPEFSPDGKFVVYRAKNENSLFVVVANSKGAIVKQHPVYERIFDPVFTDDGKSIAYGVKVGKELIWKVEKL